MVTTLSDRSTLVCVDLGKKTVRTSTNGSSLDATLYSMKSIALLYWAGWARHIRMIYLLASFLRAWKFLTVGQTSTSFYYPGIDFI